MKEKGKRHSMLNASRALRSREERHPLQTPPTDFPGLLMKLRKPWARNVFHTFDSRALNSELPSFSPARRCSSLFLYWNLYSNVVASRFTCLPRGSNDGIPGKEALLENVFYFIPLPVGPKPIFSSAYWGIVYWLQLSTRFALREIIVPGKRFRRCWALTRW